MVFDPRISELLNNFSDVSLVVSPALRITKAHGPIDFLCGFSSEEMEGRALPSMFSVDSSRILESCMKPLRARVQKAASLDETFPLNLQPLLLNKLELLAHSGKTLVQLSICPYRSISMGTGGYYYFVVLKDISYSQDLEKRQNAFLSMVNHELRTPLNGIIGLAESLKFEEKDAVRGRRFDMLLNSAHCMLKLIKGVISIADLKSNAADLNLSLVGVNDVVEEVCELITHLVDKRGRQLKRDSVNLIMKLDPNLPMVHLDRDMVHQALEAVVGNAFKFTEHGSVTICTQRDDADIEGVQISVQDTGHGISPAFLTRVFGSFQQEDERTDMRQFEGLGLGLTLAKEVCELHGGRIWVESEVGIGSTFFLVFSSSAKAMKVISMKHRNLAADFRSTDSAIPDRLPSAGNSMIDIGDVCRESMEYLDASISRFSITSSIGKLDKTIAKFASTDSIDTSFLNRPRCYEPIHANKGIRTLCADNEHKVALNYDYCK